MPIATCNRSKLGKWSVLLFGWVLALGLLASLGSCLGDLAARADTPSASLGVEPAELRSVLTDLARAHEQKMQLSLWVSTPLRPIDATFKPFYENMGKQHRELLATLRAWAKEHKIDLTFHYSADTDGQALKIMEARQEKLVRADNQADFQRDMLMQMYSDYEWQISLLQALSPKIKDPVLHAYLAKSLQVHEDGSKEILGLLKRYKFAG